MNGRIVSSLIIGKENCNWGNNLVVNKLKEISKNRDGSGVKEFGICR